MADYTHLTPEIIKELIREYDLGELVSMAPLDGGQANSSVKINTRAGAFTLSVCDEKNQEDIRNLTRVLTHLEAHKFPCTRLVTTRDATPFIHYDGKPVYVKAFIEGEVCPNLSPKMLVQVGTAMAKLHGLDPVPGMAGHFPYGLQSFDEIFDTSHPYVDWLRGKKKFLETAIDPAMKKGVIHGDIFWDNLVFSHGRLTAVLDFEEACTYYTLFDMGMAAVGCCAPRGSLSMDRIKQLITGYQQVCPLTKPEKKQLKIFVEYAAVSASFWRFRQYNLRYFSSAKKDNYRELSILADQVHAMDAGCFL
ncbi:MAG: homoserine kinase [Proteobacteria bacterium]|nr:homoserine kinase [Pseudomonadota bacterium]